MSAEILAAPVQEEYKFILSLIGFSLPVAVDVLAAEVCQILR